MAALSFSASAGEALVLGLATGRSVWQPVAGGSALDNGSATGSSGHSRQLLLFLAARLAGYLVFACAAWLVGRRFRTHGPDAPG